ncbi:MAG: hypothetical protein KDC42_07975 [Ignavibacteriae bacterium]|nr:hypothetical protein [Ignavibacteriota bacterium]
MSTIKTFNFIIAIVGIVFLPSFLFHEFFIVRLISTLRMVSSLPLFGISLIILREVNAGYKNKEGNINKIDRIASIFNSALFLIFSLDVIYLIISLGLLALSSGYD